MPPPPGEQGNPTRDENVSARLAELHRLARRRASCLVQDFEAIVDAASDVATDDEHDPEGHTIAWERQQLAALLSDARKAIESIELAEQRLGEGRYGICTICDRPVSVERLDALPETPTCVNCAAL